jgi:hypothetical protein
MMERNDQHETIDLGAATAETKGPVGKMLDFALGQDHAGLSDD